MVAGIYFFLNLTSILQNVTSCSPIWFDILIETSSCFSPINQTPHFTKFLARFERNNNPKRTLSKIEKLKPRSSADPFRSSYIIGLDYYNKCKFINMSTARHNKIWASFSFLGYFRSFEDKQISWCRIKQSHITWEELIMLQRPCFVNQVMENWLNSKVFPNTEVSLTRKFWQKLF